jgi:uncharacterized membrane protein YadS
MSRSSALALRRVLQAVRRASDFVRAILTSVLLAVVYVVVFPWYAAWTRLTARRAAGWQPPEVAAPGSLESLRRPF